MHILCYRIENYEKGGDKSRWGIGDKCDFCNKLKE